MGAGEVDVDMASLRGRGDAGGKLPGTMTEVCGDRRLSLGDLAGAVVGGGERGVVGGGPRGGRGVGVLGGLGNGVDDLEVGDRGSVEEVGDPGGPVDPMILPEGHR